MSGFAWTDRHGRAHALDRPAAIEAELAEVRRELAAHAADLEDDSKWEMALAASEPLVERNNVLITDLKRWDAHVATMNGKAATDTVAAVDRLVADAGLVRQLHGYWADHARAAMDREPGAAASASTLSLIHVVALRHAWPEPVATTAAEAHAWLAAQPETNRMPLGPADPAFAWIDRHGHAHQLRSLIDIEREQLALIGELAGLRPALAASGDAAAVAIALQKARVAMGRVSILQGDAERWAAHVGGIRRQGAFDRAKAIREFKE